MCQKEEPKSTKEECDKFFESFKSLIDKAPADIVVTGMAMLDPHRHQENSLVVATKGSPCSLMSLIITSSFAAPPLKKILSRAMCVKEVKSDISRRAEDIANNKDNC